MPYDVEQFGEYMDLAEARGVPLVVVNILCDFEINRGRLCCDGRREVVGKTRLVDVGVLERLRRETEVLRREMALACRKGGKYLSF